MRLCLTYLTYYLIKEPRHFQKIRSELEGLENLHDYRAIQGLPHLNAVIYETLRLHPPVPCAGLRVTAPEGIQVDDTHISGGMNVLVPHYTIFRRKPFERSPAPVQMRGKLNYSIHRRRVLRARDRVSTRAI